MCSISPAAHAPGSVSARSAGGGTRRYSGFAAAGGATPQADVAGRCATRSCSRRSGSGGAGARERGAEAAQRARVWSTDARRLASAPARTQDDDARRPVAHLLGLRARQLDHALRSAAGAACQRSSARAAAAAPRSRALAAGCDTSISRRIALPSFVSTMPAQPQRQRRRAARQRSSTSEPPHTACAARGARATRRRRAPPEASSNIFSIERGPSVVRMMSATACGGGDGRCSQKPSAFCAARRGAAPRAAATRLCGGDVARLRLAPRVALHVLVCAAQQRLSVSRAAWRAQRSGGGVHALNTMMGWPPMAILDGRAEAFEGTCRRARLGAPACATCRRVRHSQAAVRRAWRPGDSADVRARQRGAAASNTDAEVDK